VRESGEGEASLDEAEDRGVVVHEVTDLSGRDARETRILYPRQRGQRAALAADLSGRG